MSENLPNTLKAQKKLSLDPKSSKSLTTPFKNKVSPANLQSTPVTPPPIALPASHPTHQVLLP